VATSICSPRVSSIEPVRAKGRGVTSNTSSTARPRNRPPTTTLRRTLDPSPNHPPNEEHTDVADKSPRQHQSKKSGKSLKEKRTEKKTKQATKRPVT
jgi:hypothetical protein